MYSSAMAFTSDLVLASENLLLAVHKSPIVFNQCYRVYNSTMKFNQTMNIFNTAEFYKQTAINILFNFADLYLEY